MSRTLLTLLLALLLAGPAWPQDEPSAGMAGQPVEAEDVADEEEDPADAVGDAGEIDDEDEAGVDDVTAETAGDETEEADAIVDPDFEDEDLDVQTYEEDDDDFVPSEEIPADEPIPFPSNI